MNVTKKLVTSIICLVLSLAFCVWAVFAWFSANNAVDADGIETSVKGNDIENATVNFYYINLSTSYDSYVRGDKLDLGNDANMRDYYGEVEPTALLVEFSFTYTGETAAKVKFSFGSSAITTNTSIAPQFNYANGDYEYVPGTDTALGYYNFIKGVYLSSVIDITPVNSSEQISENGAITLSGNTSSFVEVGTDGSPNYTNSGSATNDNWTKQASSGTNYAYFVIDYNDDYIEYIYTNSQYQRLVLSGDSYVIETGEDGQPVGFTTGLDFSSHIVFNADLTYIIEQV